jgi:hypothetical protein
MQHRYEKIVLDRLSEKHVKTLQALPIEGWWDLIADARKRQLTKPGSLRGTEPLTVANCCAGMCGAASILYATVHNQSNPKARYSLGRYDWPPHYVVRSPEGKEIDPTWPQLFLDNGEDAEALKGQKSKQVEMLEAEEPEPLADFVNQVRLVLNAREKKRLRKAKE